MAKTRFVEFKYCDNRGSGIPESLGLDISGVRGSGNLVILNMDSEADSLAARSLGLKPVVVRIRGSKGSNYFEPQEVVGMDIDSEGLITPFESREAGQEVAQQINDHAEIVRRRKS